MREEDDLYKRAVAAAWSEMENHLREVTAASPNKRVEVVAVYFDPLPGESLIEELPDRPKSSRPTEVEVSIRLRATYVLR